MTTVLPTDVRSCAHPDCGEVWQGGSHAHAEFSFRDENGCEIGIIAGSKPPAMSGDPRRANAVVVTVGSPAEATLELKRYRGVWRLATVDGAPTGRVTVRGSRAGDVVRDWLLAVYGSELSVCTHIPRVA